jgi:hypothetical protein
VAFALPAVHAKIPIVFWYMPAIKKPVFLLAI